MSAEAIMTRDPVSLPPDATVAEALSLLHRHQVHNLPVVDAEGAFVGLFGLHGLTRAMLPVAAQIDGIGMPDLSYLPDDLEELAERVGELSRQPVSRYLLHDDDLTFCKPKTSIPELLYLLSKTGTTLPVLVVKGQTRTLVGVISEWDVLSKLALRLLPKTPDAGGR